jgi:hypothetical protein
MTARMAPRSPQPPKANRNTKKAAESMADHLALIGIMKNIRNVKSGKMVAKAKNSDRLMYVLPMAEPVRNAATVVPNIPSR